MLSHQKYYEEKVLKSTNTLHVDMMKLDSHHGVKHLALTGIRKLTLMNENVTVQFDKGLIIFQIVS